MRAQYGQWNLTTTDGDLPEDVRAGYLSPDDPNHWGTPALMGRWLIPSDAPYGKDPQPIVVIGYKFWQRYYLGDPGVVGRTLQLVHKPYQIVGVMPPRFKWGNTDIYLPLHVTADPNIYFGASIKLRPGVTVAQANADIQPYLEQFAKEAPARYPEKFRSNLRSITELYAKPLGPTLYLLLGAVASLLLIGCANVSILLLARGAERQQEFAVRSAVGAERLRVIRQLLTESLTIALAGTILGVLLAWRSLALIIAWLPENSFPAESVIKMNWPVLLFSVGLAFATSVLFGLSPAIQLSRPDIARLMQGSGRRVMGSANAKRTHKAMVATQVALTLLLLSAASAAGKGFLRLVKADLGYDPHATMSVPIPIHENTYGTWKDRSEYFEQIRAAIASMPEVIDAGISTNATPPENGWDTRFEIFGSAAGQQPEARVNFISPEYLTVLHIPLAQGRLFDHTETMRGAPLALINQTMARQYWPNGDAIGQQVKIAVLKDEPPYSPPPAAATAGSKSLASSPTSATTASAIPSSLPSTFPTPSKCACSRKSSSAPASRPFPSSTKFAHASCSSTANNKSCKSATSKPGSPISRNIPSSVFVATLFGIFSVLALLLAAVGLYSVVSYGVATRTNEFGIRMALGANGSDVFRMVLTSTAINVGTGLVAGIILSVVFDKLSTRWVMESSRNPLILAGVTLILIAAAALACFVPARRAASVDPMEALRYE